MAEPIGHDVLSSLPLGAPLVHEMGDVLEVGTMTVGPDLVVRGWNRWLEQASGRPAADMIGRPLLDAYPELAGSHGESALRRALAGGAVVLSQRLHRYLLPFPLRSPVGELTLMQQSVRIVPVLRDETTVDGAIAFIQDVTERVAREEELRAAIARAELASQAKSEFLASMSHELRTPLSAVVGYADLLTMEIAGPILPAQHEQLERIKRCSWHLLDLVEEILTFARTEAGREVLDLVDIDAREIARDTLVLLEPQAAKKGIRVELALPDGPVPLHSDRTKVRQILINLLGNAIKFTETGTVSLAVDDAGELVRFVVRDTGPGIPPDQTERIFEAFTQLDQSRTRVKGGTGLGLPVSRNLARLLGGDLLVESAPGAGSTFHVHIARHLAPVPTASPLTLSGGAVAIEARA